MGWSQSYILRCLRGQQYRIVIPSTGRGWRQTTLALPLSGLLDNFGQIGSPLCALSSSPGNMMGKQLSTHQVLSTEYSTLCSKCLL